MFDSSPLTNNSSVAGANNISSSGTGYFLKWHWLGNIWDPDIHDPNDFEKYIVPKEGEIVWVLQGTQIITYFVYKVYQNKSELKLCTMVQETGGTTEDQDVIFGAKGGPLNGEGLLAIDYSVRPNRARADSTIMRPGAAYALLFLGDNIDVDKGGIIISAIYDSGGVMQSNQVPVMLAAINEYENKEIFTTDAFSVTKNADALPNGARCTLVFFDRGDMVITPSQRLVVQQCSYLRDRRIGIRYVMAIELLGPWFTDSNMPNTIILPITTPLKGIVFTAAVKYSNGDVVEYPVNGNKFELVGVDEYRPTAPGQSAELTLKYTLSPDEQFYEALPGQDGRMTKVYDIVSGNVIGAYAPKLYIYPWWDAEVRAWVIKKYMYDLDRRTHIDVTNKTILNPGSPVYRPQSYGVLQNLTFQVNLRDVNPSYEPMIYKQETGIILYDDINGTGKHWGVVYAIDKPVYDGLFAQTTNNGANTKVNLKNGIDTFENWLKALYWSVIPSYDVTTEESAPTPNKLYLSLQDGRKWPLSLTDWDKDMSIGVSIQPGQTVFLEWVLQQPDGNQLQLAMTGVSVKV